MASPIRLCTHFVLILLTWSSVCFAGAMKAAVDATEIHRHLLRGTAEYEAQPGKTLDLYYPEWIPGIHAPENPIKNLAEIYAQTSDGKPLDWVRDPQNVFLFHVTVPAGTPRVVIKTTYICNQPTVNSTGIDSYGNSLLGVINWNTVLLYPAAEKTLDTQVELTLQLPEGWKWGSSLVQKKAEASQVQFEPISYEELVDSPLICGKNFNTIDITPSGETQKHYFHLVSESEQAVKLDDDRIQKMKNMVKEGLALLGPGHYDSYHLLLVLSDTIPGIGLEHLRSSLNATGERSMMGDNAIPEVLAHEFTHSWCGKYHIPAGMITPNFNTPKDTHLLWVYEGMDQYLGKLLHARSGMIATKDKDSFKAALESWAKTVHFHQQQKGRRSISLQDTAASAYLRRGGSSHWRLLNRSQDYYNEGAMLWMEMDAIIRAGSNGQKSFNDFCKAFFSRKQENVIHVGFTEEDVIEHLNDVYPYNWKELIDKRVRGLTDEISLDFVEACGYRIQYSNKATDFDKDSVRTSLGLGVDDNGKITGIVPNSPADKAGLYDGAEIVGINDRKFSKKRLEDAVADSATKRKIEFLLLNGELFEKMTIEYADGPRYMDLVRNEEKPDLFKEIWKPMVVEQKLAEKK